MENKMFKKFEVIGTTKDEAKEQVTNINLMVDATQAYNKFIANNAITEDTLKEFFKDYLKKKKYDKAGLGAYVVLQSAILDSRERPYKVNKMKYEKRTHTPEKFYVGRAQDTNTEVICEKTWAAAEKAAKEWISENHVGIDVFVEHKYKEKNALYAKVDYTPSKGTRKCKLLVFGYEAID